MGISSSPQLAEMTKRMRFWWVDDEPRRLSKSARQRIEMSKDMKGRRAQLEVKEVKNEDQSLRLEADLRSAQISELPKLIIIDQILTSASGIVLGSTLAVSLRAGRPEVPIVGVTAVAFDKIAELQKDQFIEFFCIDDLQSGEQVPSLYAIAEGFRPIIGLRKLSKNRPRLEEKLYTLLDCPAEDLELLGQCVPGEFFAAWDSETPHTFARWVWHIFTGRAGFLYDDLEIATVLGLSVAGLARVEEQLRRCEYKGVFASSARRRWWVSKVRTEVRRKFKADVAEPLWKLGRQLLPVQNTKDLSRCHGRKDDRDCVPDVVAFEDELQQDRIQARSEDTQPLDLDTPPTGFEQRRVFFRR